MESKSKFTGKLGFIMAAAGSAVGLGNLWRFPYLAARYGGGTFLIIYVILAVTFGFSLMITEITIGRKTEKSVLGAYGAIDPRFRWLGVLGALIPMIITPYYGVIGGWIVKYLQIYLVGRGQEAANDAFFPTFISGVQQPLICLIIYIGLTSVIVAAGVQKGIEKFSKVLMPVLILLSIFVAVMGLMHDKGSAGLLYYVVPDVHKISMEAIIAAAGQLFYSLSVAMGILITFGAYMKKSEPIESCVRRVEVLDTMVAFIAGLIIVPAVFSFAGGEKAASTSGPSLMFVMLPKVFNSMGAMAGSIIGLAFFFLVFLAALTSSVALMEAVVAVVEEVTHWKRVPAAIVVSIGLFLVGIPSMLGYGVWSDIRPLGMQFLDFFDFISNTIMMPILALLTCILVGWVVKPDVINDEIEQSETFKSKKLYWVMTKFVVPVFLAAILITSIVNLF